MPTRGATSGSRRRKAERTSTLSPSWKIQDLSDRARRVHNDYGSEAATIILALAYVGLRPGELFALRSVDVNLADAEVLIRFNLDGSGQEKAPKNGKPRVVTVPPAALEALSELPPRLDSPYVFHSASGRRLNRADRVSGDDDGLIRCAR